MCKQVKMGWLSIATLQTVVKVQVYFTVICTMCKAGFVEYSNSAGYGQRLGIFVTLVCVKDGLVECTNTTGCGQSSCNICTGSTGCGHNSGILYFYMCVV